MIIFQQKSFNTDRHRVMYFLHRNLDDSDVVGIDVCHIFVLLQSSFLGFEIFIRVALEVLPLVFFSYVDGIIIDFR